MRIVQTGGSEVVVKGLYRLFNDEFLRLFKATLTISLLVSIVTTIQFRGVIGDLHEHYVFERFEDVYASAGGPAIFWIGLIALFAWIVISFYSHYWGSKGIYTLLTLPVSRSAWYSGQLLALFMNVLTLMAVQLIVLSWTYHLWTSKLEGFEGDYVMNNGLFLAFLRSDFLRILFPLTLEGSICSLGMLMVIATGFYYGMLCERSKRYWGFGTILLGGYITLKAVQARTSDPLQLPYESAWSGYVYGIIFLILSGFFIWHSLRLIRKGAIAG